MEGVVGPTRCANTTFFTVSAVTGKGIKPLLSYLSATVEDLRAGGRQ